MSDGLRTALDQLLTDGHCALSQLSARTQQALAPLFDAGVLVRRRRGRGAIVEAVRQEAVRTFRDSRYPPDGADIAGPPRAVAVARWRNAKRARRTTSEPVLIRALQTICAERGSARVDLRDLTRLTGSACLLLDDGSPWTIAGTLAIVENLECFLHFERLGVPADGALYAGGRLSDRALTWLASEPMGACRFIHCGDYDPTGLAEYLRLRERLGARARLHVPDGLEGLLATYGNADLLRKSTQLLARLRSSGEPLVSRIVTAMDNAGCGLEQEVLLLIEGLADGDRR